MLLNNNKRGRRTIGMTVMWACVLRRGASAWIHPVRNVARPPTRVLAPYAATNTFTRQYATSQDNDDANDPLLTGNTTNKGAKKKSSSKKWKINENITQANVDKLAAAFDDLARKEGFDSTTAHFADSASFEDDFEDEDGEFMDDDDQIEFDTDNDDFIDFGTDELSMEDRIAAAKKDANQGRVSVPPQLDSLAREITAEDMRQLGFRPELNPFGNDETPRKEQFKIVTNAMVCSACGSDFQSHTVDRPGYLPPDKYAIQQKLSQIEELQNLKEKADSAEWTPDDEIDWLLQSVGKAKTDTSNSAEIDIDAKASELGLDLAELTRKKVICKRCHGLQNFGKVEDKLRPGYTEEPLLSQENFRNMLRPLREKPAVIIAMVDLFDFAGSVLPELDNIAGDNPVILAANKADLLPDKMGQLRVENWVRRELEYLGVKSIANIGGAVRLISCKTGDGVSAMLAKARSLADEMDCDIYVVGAANAGKSTLLNNIIGYARGEDNRKLRAGNANARKGAITTSPLPGTTLKFIKVELGDGRNLYDTPGLLVPGTLTHLLTPDELKMVVPRK
jgi:hypothetical protein